MTAATAALLGGLLLLYAAALQLNDPDPMRTLRCYLLGGLAAVWAALVCPARKRDWIAAAFVAVGCLAAGTAGLLLPSAAAAPSPLHSESGRDACGLLCVAALMGWLAKWRWQPPGAVAVRWRVLVLLMGGLGALVAAALADEEAPEHCLWQGASVRL